VRRRPAPARKAPKTASRGRRQALKSLLPRSWPLWPYPAILGLWLLGLTYLIWPLIGVLLLIVLLKRRRVEVPRGFAVWLLFLAWMLVSATQLDASDRVMAWGYRGTMYLSATALFLYLYNEPRHSLPARTIVGAIAIGWVMVVVGGLAGDLLPGVTLKSPLQLILPGGLRNIPLVRDMVTPAFSKQNAFGGLGIHRTQAPFPYPNAWGSNFVLLTPFAIWVYAHARGRRKTWWGIMILASVAPFVLSLDRGAWLALGIGLVYGALRLAQANDGRVVRWGVPAIVVLVLALFFTPLGSVVEGRIQRNYSDQGRIGRNLVAIDLVAERPLLGYGAPQEADDNPANASVGTHGQLWLVLVSHGIPGGLLFLGWVILVLVRSGRRLRSANDPRFWPHLTFAMAVVMLPYYELLPLQMFTLMAAAALVFRDGEAETKGPPRLLGDYVKTIRSRIGVVAATSLLLAAAALAFSVLRPVRYESTATVAAGVDVVQTGLQTENDRLVTEAQVASSPVVTDRIPGLMPPGTLAPEAIQGALTVRAVPESRVLEFNAVTADPRASRLLAEAGARAYLAYGQEVLGDQQALRVDRLERLHADIARDLKRFAATMAITVPRSAEWRTAAKARDRALIDYDEVGAELARVRADTPDAGVLISNAERGVRATEGPIRPAATAGLAGLVLGSVVAFSLRSLRGRPRRIDDVASALGTRVVAVVPRSKNAGDTLALRDRMADADADSYRVLRTAVLAMLPDGRGSVIVCRAPGSRGEAASNLAVGLAMGGRRTALLDLVPGGGAPPGLLGRPMPKLAVVRPDRRARRGVRGFDGEAVAGALHTLTERHEVVVIDAPFAGFADVLPVARAASAVLIEIDADEETGSSLAATRQLLRRSAIQPSGAVVRGRIGT
jgi:polysaccharide biosynthesis protein PslJ